LVIFNQGFILTQACSKLRLTQKVNTYCLIKCF